MALSQRSQVLVALTVTAITLAGWEPFVARPLAIRSIRPIAAEAPFNMRLANLDGSPAEMPRRDCSVVIISDAFCAGCRTVARNWEVTVSQPEPVWVLINTVEVASQYAQLFFIAPKYYFVMSRLDGIPRGDVIHRLELQATPTTLILDSALTILEIRPGVADARSCDKRRGES